MPAAAAPGADLNAVADALRPWLRGERKLQTGSGEVPLFAAVRIDPRLWEQLPDFRARARWFIDHNPWLSDFLHLTPGHEHPLLVTLVSEYRLRRVLARMLDESEFLSPFGLRSLSRYHRDQPLVVSLPGGEARLD